MVVSDPPPDPEAVHLPAGIHYQCVECGRSCSGREELDLDPESMVRLSEGADLESLATSLNRQPFFVPSLTRPGEHCLKQVNGSCCFLTPQRQCSIHRQWGHDALPTPCQEFPFSFIETPEGAFVGVSFACTAILQSNGPDIQERREQLVRQRAGARTVTRVGQAIVLGEGGPEVSWETYVCLEGGVADVLALENLPLEARLQASWDLVCMADRAARAMPGQTGEAVAALVRRYRDGRWTGLTSPALNRKGSAPIQRVWVNLVATAAEDLGEDVSPGGWAIAYAEALWHHGARRGLVRLEGAPLPLKYSILDTVPVEIGPGTFYDHLSGRWWKQMIFRKDLLTAGPTVVGAFGRLLLRHATLHWYWGLNLLREGKTGSARTALIESMRHVERRFREERALERVLEKRKPMAAALDGAIGKPGWAAAMLTQTIGTRGLVRSAR